MLTDGLHRSIDLLFEFCIQDEIDFRIDIPIRHPPQHVGQCRTELVEVGFLDTLVFEVTDRRTSSAVVGGSEDEDDIRLSEIVHTRIEGTRTVVIAVIACITNGRSAIGIIDS